MAVERVLSNLNLISFKTEEGLQNHIDELQDGDLVFTPDSSLKGNLFDFKWTDHKLDDMSWLNADTFSWQSGYVYVAAYNHLVEDFDGITAETETIGSTTVTFYRAEDGHKICMPDQEANVQALYEATGVAWYYILDTANKQFKLPRTKFGFTGLRDSVGNYVEAGLPNITGNFNAYSYGEGASSGAISSSVYSANQLASGTQSSFNFDRFTINANRSNSIYGNSNTVQPKATQMYLYFYVGNFERDAIEQTAGLNAEMFNDKADAELVNSINSILSAVDSRVSTLESDVRIIGFQLPLSGNAYSFYIKFSNGLVVQGRNTVAAAGVWNLPVPMQDANYVVATSYVTSESSNTPQWRYMGVAKTSTTVTPAQNGLAQSVLVLGMAA